MVNNDSNLQFVFVFYSVFSEIVSIWIKIKALATKIPRHCANFWYAF